MVIPGDLRPGPRYVASRSRREAGGRSWQIAVCASLWSNSNKSARQRRPAATARPAATSASSASLGCEVTLARPPPCQTEPGPTAQTAAGCRSAAAGSLFFGSTEAAPGIPGVLVATGNRRFRRDYGNFVQCGTPARCTGQEVPR